MAGKQTYNVILYQQVPESTIFEKSDHRSDWLYGNRLSSLIRRVKTLENLTNEKRGDGVERGRLSYKELERVHGSKPVYIDEIKEKGFVNRSLWL